MKKVNRFVPEILVLVYVILFFVTRQPTNAWDRIIASDGKGYYAYLTALFIYHDTDFGFIDEYEAKYYPPGNELYKDFRYDSGHGIVNKYFPGPAVLWIPFFALGHLLAIFCSYPTDGYSLPYQMAIALAAFFYFWLALRVLQRLLRFFTNNQSLISWVLIAIALATNLIYYTVNASSQVHVYNFFLISAFVFSVLSFCQSRKLLHISMAAFFLGVILISRPQNGIVIFSIPFLCGSKESFVSFLKSVFLNTKNLLFSLLCIILPLLIPVTFWIFKTGQPLVYTYGIESYNFLEPHMLLFLFSFEKGWMLYTPITVFALIGFGYLFMKSKWQAVSLALFLFFVVYFLSSWWIWNYTSFISQRVMIDFYPYIAILLVCTLLGAAENWRKLYLPIIVMLFVALNLFQHFQQLRWIYPAGPVTASAYFSNFFSLSKANSYYIPQDEIHRVTTFKLQADAIQQPFVKNNLFVSGYDKEHPKSLEFDTNPAEKRIFTKGLHEFGSSKSCILRVSARYFCSSMDSSFIINASFGSGNKIYSVNRNNIIPGFRAGKWSYIEMALYMPYRRSDVDSLFMSISNRNGNKVFVDDLKVDFIQMKDLIKYDWIPSAIDDVDSVTYFSTDFEKELKAPWGNMVSISADRALSGSKSSMVNGAFPYSVSFELTLDTSSIAADGYLKVKSNVLFEAQAQLSLVFDFSQKGKTVFYKSYPISTNQDFGNWTLSECFRELPMKLLKADKVKVYYWLQSGEKNVYFDNLSIEFVRYKPMKLPYQSVAVNANYDKLLFNSCENFEEKLVPPTGNIQESEFALSGRKVCMLSDLSPYSFSQRIQLSGSSNEGQFISVSASLLADMYKTSSVLVVDFQHEGKSVNYVPFYLNGSTRKGVWTKVFRKIKVPAGIAKGDSVLIYFYSPTNDEKLLIDDFCVKLTEEQ